MPQQLHGYEDNLNAKGSALREVTVTKQGDKAALDVALASDVQIGAVEIKDGTTDQRAGVTANGELQVSLLAGTIYVVPPATFTGAYSGNQTSETLITPTAGKQLQIIGVQITSDDAVFDCKVEFETSGIIISQHFEQGTLGGYIPVNLTGATDEVLSLTITGSAGQNWFFTINYAEQDP